MQADFRSRFLFASQAFYTLVDYEYRVNWKKKIVFEGEMLPQREAERPDWRKIKVFRFVLYMSLKNSFNILQTNIKIIFKFIFKKRKYFLENWSEKLNTFFRKTHLSLCYFMLQSDFKK